MQRDKFPEKIPFRLTRMLVNAMEVSGIHGSYKKSCEVTMDVLRDNKDSLMAVLEAFVYDPLIAWRLIANATKDTEREREPRKCSARVSRQGLTGVLFCPSQPNPHKTAERTPVSEGPRPMKLKS